jgi:hypothetical protein
MRVYGGTLIDKAAGKTLPVFGVSEYDIQTVETALTAQNLYSINPQYSNSVEMLFHGFDGFLDGVVKF